ncbi:YcnI family copper-binding membrane protein [Peribacillus glennii]|uniref:DUF1775 domain-containing protein n=1 Tax=Peribacillus glennii TaxID=2303991 RepID=A0A372L846_9BACI|nr:DUF1775 domain-containing protein [Peribacillus glennii]RFU60935.1 DUF1775 domain-containing protein [Peribacillus glennii]
MKILWKKWSVGFTAIAAALFLYAGAASAHVTVIPGESAPGAWETYMMKVPVEKNVNTVKVALKVPDGVEVMSYQPVPGWEVTQQKDGSGKTTTITWTATGDGIAAGQFQQFSFVGKNPEKETEAAWDAFQYYKDGSIVEWTGDESSDTPHSITKITSSTDKPEGQTHNEQETTDKNTETKSDSGESGSNAMVLTTSIVALVVSILALILSLRKK